MSLPGQVEPLAVETPPPRQSHVAAYLLVTLLVLGCLVVVSPLLLPAMWAVVLAVTFAPAHRFLRRKLQGRGGLAALLLMLALTVCMALPLLLVAHEALSYVPGVITLGESLRAQTVPQLPTFIVDLPIVGPKIAASWAMVEAGKVPLVSSLAPRIISLGEWALDQGGSWLDALFWLLVSIAVGGVLLAKGQALGLLVRRIVERAAGATGLEMLPVAVNTVRAVAFGIVGIALVQSVLSAIGYAVAGVPGASLLGLVAFFLGVVQLPTFILWLPAVLWLWHEGSTVAAILLAVYCLVVIDGGQALAAPVLIQSRAPAPLAIIIVGVIGGLITMGLLGMFLGPTLLAVGYALLMRYVGLQRT